MLSGRMGWTGLNGLFDQDIGDFIKKLFNVFRLKSRCLHEKVEVVTLCKLFGDLLRNFPVFITFVPDQHFQHAL